MIKMVYKDYRHGFWEALKKNCNFTAWYMYIYIAVLALIHFRETNIMMILGFVPMVIGLMLARAYPNQLSKVLFLCPLSENDRRVYLKTAYWIRVLLPVSMCLISSTVAAALGFIQLFYYMEMNLLIISYLVGINVYCLPKSWKMVDMPKDQWDMRMPYAYELLNVFLQLVGLIGICLFGFSDLIGIDEGNDKIFLTVFVIVEALLSLAAVKIYYKPVMERGLWYESCYPAKADW